MPGNLWLDVRHCEFYLVGGGYFCIAIHIHELCSRTQLSYLVAVWSFWVLLLRFIRWDLRGILHRSLAFSLCAPLWYFVLQTSAYLVSPDTCLHLLNPGSPCASPGFPLHAPWPGAHPRQCAGVIVRLTLFAFHLSGIIALHCLTSTVLKMAVWQILSLRCCCCFRHKGKASPPRPLF